LTIKNNSNFRIEICGGIASGKTTLATLLKKIDIEPILENFQINPFWQSFYTDPISYAFETEITFLLQHYHQIKASVNSRNKTVYDFSLFLDLAYANVTLNYSQREIFLSVYNHIRNELSSPSLLIYLHCEAPTELERIRRRGRTVEESISLEFLSKLNYSLEQCVLEVSKSINVISINSEQQDFANDESVKQALLDRVAQALF
jgi:deoxyadenosine/deoxycytidine kinase